MKLLKILLTSAICLLTLTTQAQVHESEDLTVNAGIGLGSVLYGTISLNAAVEYAISDEFSIGGALGYSSYSDPYDYDYLFGYENFRINVFYIGPRGTYHFAEALNLDTDQFDLYAGGFVGLAIVIVKLGGETVEGFAGPSTFGYNFFGGARYYFNPKIAAYAELGLGISVLQMGITFKI